MARKTTQCKGCGEDITWVTMVSGKSMPLDPKPVNGVQIKEDIGQVIQTFTPHWSTCSRAKDFKKDKP